MSSHVKEGYQKKKKKGKKEEGGIEEGERRGREGRK